MRRLSRALPRVPATAAISLLLAIAAQAAWTIESSEAEFSTGRNVEHRQIVAVSESGDRATLHLALVAQKSASLRLIDNANGNERLRDAMQRQQCLAGVNGGYFNPNDAPVGLLVVDGRVISPFAKARLLSGVLANRNGRTQIYRSNEFPRGAKWSAALQCGPFLVDRGQAVPGLESTRLARRTFVSADGDRVVLGFCTQVSLAQLAAILTTPDVKKDLKIQRTLNLDGGSSSAFWFADEGKPFSISEQKTVCDFVAIVPK